MAKTKKVRFDIDHEELIRLYKSGMSVRQLQSVFHMCGEHISATLDYLKVKRHKPKGYNVRKLTDYEFSIKRLFYTYRTRAKRKQLPFKLTLDMFEALTKSDCFYCGAKAIKSSRSILERDYTLHCNGVDRVDSGGGYTQDNVVACCSKCNTMKMQHNVDDFISHISRIYKHQNR